MKNIDAALLLIGAPTLIIGAITGTLFTFAVGVVCVALAVACQEK